MNYRTGAQEVKATRPILCVYKESGEYFKVIVTLTKFINAKVRWSCIFLSRHDKQFFA